MKPRNEMERRWLALPREVVALCTIGEGAWVVGSAANAAKPFDDAKDFDIVVPYAAWSSIAPSLPHLGTVERLTKFGGIVLRTADGVRIDVWPDDVVRILMLPRGAGRAWHPKSGTVLRRDSEDSS